MELPDWQFDEVISPATLAEDWLGQGVQVLGGFCGLGVEHMVALRKVRDRAWPNG